MERLVNYRNDIENKLSDKYKTHFNLTPVKENDQVISYKDKLILDTSRSFNSISFKIRPCIISLFNILFS